MPDWSSGDVDAGGVRLHYTRTGGGGPQLVLLHGVTDSGLCWTPVAAALAADYDVIMVDARGHGASEATESGYDPATQAADVRGLVAALGLGRPVVIGHSMGAMTTLALAGLFPEVPRAVVLEDPPDQWLPADPAARAERAAGMRAWAQGVKQKSREQLIAEQRASSGWPEAELGPWADSKLQFSEHVFGAARPTARTIDWAPVLPRVACPALLVAGDRALGAAISSEGIDALRAAVPQLRVAQIAGAGHNVRRDRFADFMDAVLPFLREVAG